jgi:hypothetical protein
VAEVAHHPVAVGGVGGSGTRLVAQWLGELGFHTGEDLNDAHDNLWYSLLFKRRDLLLAPAHELRALQQVFLARLAGTLEVTPEVRALVEGAAATPHPKYAAGWLAERAASFLRDPTPHERWAWKEPNTHVLVEQFLALEPRLRYVHLDRNGLAMAYSRNNQQVRLWGPVLLGREVDAEPRDKLAYWCAAHRRMSAIAEQHDGRVLMVRFESLLEDPTAVLARIAAFAGVEPPAGALAGFAAQLRAPVDRVVPERLGELDPADLDYLRSVGYLA